MNVSIKTEKKQTIRIIVTVISLFGRMSLLITLDRQLTEIAIH